MDLNMDKNYLKKVLNHGVGQERFTTVDEVLYTVKIYQEENKPPLVHLDFSESPQILCKGIDDARGPVKNHSSNVLKIMRTMKSEEEVICKV